MMEELLAHLLAVQLLDDGLDDGLEQWRDGLQATGERAGRDRQPLVAQVLQSAVDRLAVAVLAQDDLDPKADTIVAAGKQTRWRRGAEDGRGVLAGAAGVAGIGRASDAAYVRLDLDLDDVAVLVQCRVGATRQATGQAALLIVIQIVLIGNDGEIRALGATVP
jgi:hypothetical protein